MHELRASDAEREETVSHLREQAAAGRLSVDELDERCAQAYSARTVRELSDLVIDLPAPASPLPVATSGSTAPAEPLPAVRGIGARPFTYEWELEVAPTTAMTEALRHIAPALNRRGYELINKRPDRLVFCYYYRPGWTYGAAILLFPIGLVALLHQAEERITLDFDPLRQGRTRLVAHGRAPRRVRRAFAQLLS